MKTTPIFSLLYPTRGRPEQCLSQLHKWLKEGYIEIILCIGSDEEKKYAEVIEFCKTDERIKVITNRLPRCEKVGYDTDASKYSTAITSWNFCAKQASCDWLVAIADDLEPFDGWFLKLGETIIKSVKSIDTPAVLVTKQDNARGLICHPIMNRAEYERLGYFWNPKYLHTYCDNDLWVTTSCDGSLTVVEDFSFVHHHPMLMPNENIPWDSVYSQAYNKDWNDLGKAMFAKRLEELEEKYGKSDFKIITGGRFQVSPINKKIEGFVEEVLETIQNSPVAVVVASPKLKAVPSIQRLQDSEFMAAPYGVQTLFIEMQGQAVDQARNNIIHYAMEKNAKYLIMVDDDVALPRDGLNNLITTADRFNGDVAVTGVCCVKMSNIPAIAHLDDQGRLVLPNLLPQYDPVEINWGCGGACILIPVKFFHELLAHDPELPFSWLSIKDGTLRMGEDIFMTSRILRHINRKIYVDTRVQCMHFDMKKQEYRSYLPVDESKYVTIFSKDIKRIA
jgi:hypothetical protein